MNCPTCKGKGVITFRDVRSQELYSTTCSDCSGSGKVNQTAKSKVKK